VVEDQGEGIEPENLTKIFDPYFTTKSTGCGLGLALCFSIIKKHKGSIRVESELAKGTTFILDLPAVVGSDNEFQSEKDLVEAARRHEGTAALKILVMDDDPELQEVMIEILSMLGHNVVAAGEGREALRVYQDFFNRQQTFDLVILDLTIPGGMGGLETFKKLKKFNPDVKAVVSSGYSTDPIMANYAEYGFVGSISKPFTIAGVKSCVDLTVSKSGV
jgi:CheY-like chemotaxis protein